MLLEISGLQAGYGGVTVLHDLALRIDAGETAGLFGPNGHGKTTLLKTISGLVPARGGTIRFAGTDITTAKPGRIVELGLVHVPQGNLLFPDCTVAEALALGAWPKRARAREAANRARVEALFPRLAERRRQKIHGLSGGERQMLAIGVALMAEPALLLLDEPTLGLAPKVRGELAAAITALAAGGLPMLVVEQDLRFLGAVCPRLVLIDRGHVVLEAPSGTIDEDAIMTRYFGDAA
jgi:branched-chain amino acid transport system ATP-binding protein